MEQDNKLTQTISELINELNKVKQDLADMKAKCQECQNSWRIAIEDCKSFERKDEDDRS